MKLIAALAVALLTVVSTSAQAKVHHRVHTASLPATSGCVQDNNGRTVCSGSQDAHQGFSPSIIGHIAGGSLTTINCAGKNIKVASSAASKFEGFCSAMASAGYNTKLIGGWRPHGSCRGCNMHPLGLAIDYGQRGRDLMTLAISRSEASSIAHRYGLVSGGDWCHPDLGHFEVDIGTNAPACSTTRIFAARQRHHYASR